MHPQLLRKLLEVSFCFGYLLSPENLRFLLLKRSNVYLADLPNMARDILLSWSNSVLSD